MTVLYAFAGLTGKPIDNLFCVKTKNVNAVIIVVRMVFFMMFFSNNEDK